MKRLNLDEILGEKEELQEPIIQHHKKKVNFKCSDSTCRTGKVSYETALDAKKASSYIKKNRHEGTTWYKCKFCGKYHLTSIKKQRKGRMHI